MSPTTAPADASRRITLALSLAGFSCFMLLYGTQPLLPQLADTFAIGPGTASLSVTAGTGLMALLLIPLSLLTDRYGRERLMRYGLLGAAAFSLASAWAPDFWLLVLARAGLGLCIAGVPAAAMAHLGEELPMAERARAMGLYIGANALGGMAGRLLAASVSDWTGSWHYGLAAVSLLGLVVAIAFWRLLPPAVHFEARSLQPRQLFADVRRIYADPGLPWLFCVAFLGMGTLVGLYNYLPFLLGAAPYGLGPAAIGSIFLLYAIGSYSSAWAGQQVARRGRQRILLAMALLLTAGIAVTLAPPLWLIVSGLAVYTFGFFAVHSVASAWVGHRAGPRRGLVSALYLASYYLGGSVIGTATGWAWSHAGWPGVIAAMLACGLAVTGIAWRLRRLATD
ncbi:MFS transporter [Azonexus hydrophilus]|uniref:MFS transporter n=1 Tax=Azonexus hydrophilus TaxID=418702 RepID=UPI001F0ACB59|nr:MFS transporter [Azonexus hydrophilus]